MDTVKESICCKEIQQMAKLMEDEGVSCIVDHPRFRSGCLDEWTLHIAYLGYRQQHGDMQQHSHE